MEVRDQKTKACTVMSSVRKCQVSLTLTLVWENNCYDVEIVIYYSETYDIDNSEIGEVKEVTTIVVASDSLSKCNGWGNSDIRCRIQDELIEVVKTIDPNINNEKETEITGKIWDGIERLLEDNELII